MDDDRRRTLLTLVELAESWDPVGCWGPERAAVLLRNQSSAEELRSIGVPDEVVTRIWATVEKVDDR